MTLLKPTTGDLISKGAHNQKDVLRSIVRTEVSKSVGLIHIDGRATATGFRVGEKYIATCAHVISGISPTYFNTFTKFNSINFLQKLIVH